MKKAFKLFFIYLGVLVLALIATTVFCGGFLFFYRDGNIFGVRYISTKQIIQANESEDMSDLSKVKIKGDDFDINISVNSSVTELKGAMYNKVFGYTYKDKAQAEFALEYDSVTKTATFDIKEPSGWINKKSSYIQIAVPVDLALKGFDLEVSGDKADINISEDEHEFNIKNIKLQSTNGNVVIKDANIVNNLTVSIGKGDFKIDKTCTSSNNIDAVLSVGTGRIDLSKINLDKFTFGTIDIKKNKHGEIGIMKCRKLITDGDIESGGKIYINNVGFVDFISKNTDLIIGSITDIDISRIKLSGIGDIKINSANCPLELETYNGDIKVGTSSGSMILKANQGDILVSEALGYIAADSVYGKIKISFSESANGYDEIGQHRAVQATTKNGSIEVVGLEKGVVTATDKGRINLRYNKVVGDNVVNSKSGSIYIVVPNPESASSNECAFNLKVETEISSDIKVGVAGSIGKVDSTESGIFEYTNIYNSLSSTKNNLQVKSTNGIIKIRSQDLVQY